MKQWNVLCQQPFKLKALFICQQKNYISLTRKNVFVCVCSRHLTWTIYSILHPHLPWFTPYTPPLQVGGVGMFMGCSFWDVHFKTMGTAWNTGCTFKEGGSFTATGFMMLSMTYGPTKRGDSIRDSTCSGKSREESHTSCPGV